MLYLCSIQTKYHTLEMKTEQHVSDSLVHEEYLTLNAILAKLSNFLPSV